MRSGGNFCSIGAALKVGWVSGKLIVRSTHLQRLKLVIGIEGHLQSLEQLALSWIVDAVQSQSRRIGVNFSTNTLSRLAQLSSIGRLKDFHHTKGCVGDPFDHARPLDEGLDL